MSLYRAMARLNDDEDIDEYRMYTPLNPDEIQPIPFEYKPPFDDMVWKMEKWSLFMMVPNVPNIEKDLAQLFKFSYHTKYYN